jgi:hypothetical protein
MTTIATTDRTPLHDEHWTRSASGLAIRTRVRGLHLSIWRRPQGGPYRFTLSGALPAGITGTTEAVTFLWQNVVSRIGRSAA